MAATEFENEEIAAGSVVLTQFFISFSINESTGPLNDASAI